MARDAEQGDRTKKPVCPKCGLVLPGGWIGRAALDAHYEQTHMTPRERVESGRGSVLDLVYVAFKYPKRTRRIVRENLRPLQRWLESWWNRE